MDATTTGKGGAKKPSDFKSKFKKFTKSLSTDKIKKTFSKASSKDKIPDKLQENVPPVPVTPEEGGKTTAPKTPEPKATHPKSPLAAVAAMKSTPFNSPEKKQIDVTRSPSPPVVPKTKPSAPPLPKIEDEGDAKEDDGGKRSARSILINCSRVVGAGVALLALKAAVGRQK
ncbi:hypothetical protein HOP50_13g69470 [Chloropicon primus]|uniref:Uncharacterized protein n=2 Tax=Chloropicon primus TaxID=1764295 RepID=A0A5B8MV25_9CHLO|nr:hypothetical protein A3770_13p69270 [Chloropicon primus]UPR03617.1 hypothetical protein HOP50_13g69470 [Chloropicon primus]|eukprot:QDZ24409.1 hypothetical protein A3770_13p69270 [Chloropicon primus]